MSFLDDFLEGNTTNKSDEELISNKKENLMTFTIKKVEVDNYKFPFGQVKSMIFHIEDQNKKKSQLAQPVIRKSGEEISSFGDLLYPMYWNKRKEEPVASSLVWDLKESIKIFLGEEKYEERKKEFKGINAMFFKNAQFEARLNEGTSKKGVEYYIVELPSKSKINFWKYLIDRGEYAEFKDIPEVQKTFDLEQYDNTEIVEEVIEPDDLPF